MLDVAYVQGNVVYDEDEVGHVVSPLEAQDLASQDRTLDAQKEVGNVVEHVRVDQSRNRGRHDRMEEATQGDDEDKDGGRIRDSHLQAWVFVAEDCHHWL